MEKTTLELTKITHHAMRDRCENKNSHSFKHYGGRGIKINASWTGRGGFKRFCDDLKKTIGLRPTINHSIERVDVEKGYFIENLKWILKTSQPKNRRNCYFINGKCASDAARDLGVPSSRLIARMNSGKKGEEVTKRPSKNDHAAVWKYGWATPKYISNALGLSRVRVWQLISSGVLKAENQTKDGGVARWWVKREIFETYISSLKKNKP